MLAAALASPAGILAAVSPDEATAPSSQRQSRVTGVVQDAVGPVVGATVFVRGTTNGTVTDALGGFTLDNVRVGDVLVVSFVGYVSQEVEFTGQAEISVTLADAAQEMGEVVVVGFGTQRKANLTGAVATLSADNIAARPVNSVVDAMQGMIPGMNFSIGSGGGAVNSDMTFNIRGMGTIGAGSSVAPLVLIDGTEGDINSVNPQDVDNISVLKDAASSSIYGSRAAGGVILITTKRGRAGKMTVNYNNNFRFSTVNNMPEQMDSYTWALYMNHASQNAGSGTWFSEAKLQQIRDAQANPSLPQMFANSQGRWEIWDNNELLPVGNRDWLKTTFGTGFSQEHNVSVSGGSERVRYYLSANYLHRGGNLKHGDDRRKRYIASGKIDADLTSWLRVAYSTRFTRIDDNTPEMLDGLYYHNMCRYWPIIPLRDPNGHFTPTGSNPGDLTDGGRKKQQDDRFVQQLTARLSPVRGLTLNAELNYRTFTRFLHDEWLTTYAYDVNNSPYVFNNSNNAVREYALKTNFFNPNVYADYGVSFAEAHNVKVLMGYQSEDLQQRWFWARQYGIIADLPALHTTATNPGVDGQTGSWATQGVFARLNYDYRGRYLAEGNLRYDGSSRFLQGKRWIWSPSFSVGWNVAQERFWEPLEQVVGQLKFRFSWGRLSNQNTDSWYPFYSTMGYTNEGGTWLVDGKKQNIASMPALVSTSLTWEKNSTLNFGLDFGLFGNRLTGSFEVFRRNTYDMVGPGEELPSILGAAVPNVNNLDMTSRGFELQVGWQDLVGDFSYGAQLTLSDSRVRIDKYPNPSKNLSSYYEGAYLGDIWGYTTVGIAKTEQEMAAHLANADQNALGNNWGAGDIMYADLNGDGKVDGGQGTAGDPGDRRVIGNSTPRYNFGLNLTAGWKGFDLKVFFQGTLKRDYYPGSGDAVFWGACGIGKWQAAGFKEHLDFFRDDPNDPLGLNLDSYYPKANWSGSRNNQAQTRYLQNAAYCRLKNLTVGYTLPHDITRLFYVQNLRLFFSAENLATMTKFTKLGDPEIIDAEGWGFSKTYPLSRNYSFGVGVTF